MSSLIVYRGSGERSRLALIVRAASQALGDIEFIWAVPQGETSKKADVAPQLEGWLRSHASSRLTLSVVDGQLTAVPATVKRLAAAVDRHSPPSLLVGFTALAYATAFSEPWVWFANGIPEERLQHQDGVLGRLAVATTWKLASRSADAALVVTVSEPMSDLICNRVGLDRRNTFAVPTCVDSALHQAAVASNRDVYAYSGTGAPWQWIEHLAEVWGRIATRDESSKFLVVSRDDRCRSLGKMIPPERFEMIGTDDRGEVASMLARAHTGFSLRQDNLVNRASFPTKIGEYAAAGASVVTSDIDWDPRRFLRQAGVGLLVDPSLTAEEVAERVVEWPGDRPENLARLVASLDRDHWADRLATELLAVAQ